MASKQSFKTVDEYIRTFPSEVQRILKTLRRTVQEAVPQAVETISYQIPTFKLRGILIVSFAAWKHHIGIYPIPAGSKTFQREIARYKGAKSTLRFPIDEPIPYHLVARMVTFRVKEESKKKRTRFR